MKFLDLNIQYNLIKEEVDRAVQKVLDSSQFIDGEETKKFERNIAKLCGTKYAVSVDSGTDALFLSLKALGVKNGDEVITTPFSFIATVEVIANLGARPVLADIDPTSFNISPSEIRKKITEKTKVILPVHLFGNPAEMKEIKKIAEDYKLKIVEDAAQAIGSKYDNHPIGGIGDIGCFSFYPTKNLGAYGDGGMVVTNDKKIAEKIRLLRNHGSSPRKKYLNLSLGTNSRLDEIQAAILRVKMNHLSDWNNKRAEIASYYNKMLRGVEKPQILKNRDHVFHQYTIRLKRRDDLKKYLEKKGIPTRIYYPIPLHLQPALSYLNYKKGGFPEAEKASEEVLSLPIYPEILESDLNKIVNETNNFFDLK
jgi:hypothetical protein